MNILSKIKSPNLYIPEILKLLKWMEVMMKPLGVIYPCFAFI